MTDKKETDKAGNIFKTLVLKRPGEFYTIPIQGGEEVTRNFLDHCCGATRTVEMKLVPTVKAED